MKLKHNKKRNTAFLFEALIREITKCAVNGGDKSSQDNILKIIKEFFNKNSILSQELKLYKSILETRGLSKRTAERILSQVIKRYDFLDKKKIFEAQSKLIKKVNREAGKDVYSNFIPNYITVATVYQMLNGNLEPKTYVMMENEIIDYMSSTEEEQEQKKFDKVVFKTYLDRFNETYDKQLNKEQKKLLAYYVNSFNDNGLEFKMYLNEETDRLIGKISRLQKSNPKLDKVLRLIESFKTRQFDDKLLKKVLQIQKLVEELNPDEN
jgi:hypothetical protein